MKRYPQCILASCCIPWDDQWNFMEEMFRKEVRLVVRETPHIYLFGTSGEGYAISEELFTKIVKVFAEEMEAADGKPMVGLIHVATAQIKERIELCRDIGITKFQISLPPWAALNEWELFHFFEDICGRYEDCEFLHYNVARSKRIVNPEEYAKLEQLHPNLVATKITTDSIRYIGRLMELSTELRHFFTDLSFAYASSLGECGLLIAMATSNWKAAHAYYAAATGGKYREALDYQKQLLRMNSELRSIVLKNSHIDGAFDKMYVKLHQPEFPLRLYPPYRGSDMHSFNRFRSFLETDLPMWYPR